MTAFMLAGCVTAGREAGHAYVTAEGYERMSEAVSFQDKRAVVRTACIESGLPEGTRRHARCVAGYFAMDAKVARERAKEMRRRAVDRHGYCIDPDRLTARRCLEI